MNKTDVSAKLRRASREMEPIDIEIPPELYEGIDLAPKTQESLVTWDVSGRARREQDRLSSATRAAKDVRGGY
jgi:hypothetical protein